jgi:hypothetical protein
VQESESLTATNKGRQRSCPESAIGLRAALRRFRFESEMLPHVAHSVHATLRIGEHSDVTIVSGLTVGAVIPDLVVGVWHVATPVAPLARLSYIEASVLCVLQCYGSMTLDELNRHIHLTDSGATRALAGLSHKGAIARLDQQVLAVDDERLRGLEIVAIELKMRRWRDAVKQAVSYRQFADRAYAVLDATQTRVSERMLEAFEGAGVGLLMQYGSYTKELVPALQSRPITAARIQVTRTLALRAARERRALLTRESAPLFEDLEPDSLMNYVSATSAFDADAAQLVDEDNAFAQPPMHEFDSLGSVHGMQRSTEPVSDFVEVSRSGGDVA